MHNLSLHLIFRSLYQPGQMLTMLQQDSQGNHSLWRAVAQLVGGTVGALILWSLGLPRSSSEIVIMVLLLYGGSVSIGAWISAMEVKSPGALPLRKLLAYWILIWLLHFGIPLLLGLCVALLLLDSTAGGAGLVGCIGIGFGNIFAVHSVLRGWDQRWGALRLILLAACLILTGEILGMMADQGWFLLAAGLLGVALAQLRLGSWACLTVWLGWLMLWPQTLRRPLVLLDELRLLPLPGVQRFMRRAAKEDSLGVSRWLIAWSKHGADGWRALRFVQQLSAEPAEQRVLLELSLSAEALPLLVAAGVAKRGSRSRIYAQLAQPFPPGAWCLILKQATDALGQSATLAPLEQGMLELFHWCLLVLEACRWADLRHLPALPEAGSDSRYVPAELWTAAVSLNACAGWMGVAHSEQELLAAGTALTADLLQLTGWPGRLGATVVEHLRYLAENTR